MLENIFSYETTECVADLDWIRKKIIFESILTTFKLSLIFRGSWDCSINWLEPKTKPPKAKLAFPNLWNSLYVKFLSYNQPLKPSLLQEFIFYHFLFFYGFDLNAKTYIFLFWKLVFNCNIASNKVVFLILCDDSRTWSLF